MIHVLSSRRHKRPPKPAARPAHRLIRDAVEAEEIAVDWLRWRGFGDAHRVGTDRAQGVVGSGIVADVTFDPLPIEHAVLAQRMARAEAAPECFVSFTFAGWTPDLLAWADQHSVALVRFNFAGDLDPSNDAARRLHRA